MARLGIALLASCGGAALREPVARPTPWCFALEAERYGVTHYSRACADSAELCAFAQDRAVAFAGFAHFTAVGECRLDVVVVR